MLREPSRRMGGETQHDGPPADVDVGMVVRLLGELPHPVHVGKRTGEIAAVDLLHEHVAVPAPRKSALGQRLVDLGEGEPLGQGCVISSGRTAPSNCSPVR